MRPLFFFDYRAILFVLMKTLEPDENLSVSPSAFTKPVFLVFFVVTVLLGIGVGFVFSKTKKTSVSSPTGTTSKMVGKTIGIADKKTFKDQAEGILQAGGIDSEGSFHLERPGGVSQNVYLTSSTVDLAPYVGKKIRVWGETFTGDKAGWLMDVGLVEILN